MLFLLVFFLVPFFFAFKISFAESAISVPPFTKLFSWTQDNRLNITLIFDNYKRIFAGDEEGEFLYMMAYLYSVTTAFFSTVICLLIGYPMAYAMSRAQKTTQNLLLLIIILPFWTSFLLRVYALESIIREK